MTSGNHGAHAVALGKVPSNDPLAFCSGFFDGLSGRTDVNKADSDAYAHGVALGARVARGETAWPTWARRVA